MVPGLSSIGIGNMEVWERPEHVSNTWAMQKSLVSMTIHNVILYNCDYFITNCF